MYMSVFLLNTLFRIPKDFCYITILLKTEGFYNTVNNLTVEIQEFIIKGRNVLRSVLFPVRLKVFLNVAYSCNIFNVTQRMESIPNGDSASRPGL